jgi:hypothetical protein
MKKKIIYIRLFSIIGIICILGFIVMGVVGVIDLFKVVDSGYSRDSREGYTNNGLDIYNNLSFGRGGGSGGGSGGGGGGSGSGYDDDGVAEKWGYGWGEPVVKQFLGLQSTLNPQYIFNVNKIQKYISKDEVEEFLANGKWDWSDETKQMYLNYINHDIRSKEWVDASFDMKLLQTVYSESAIKKLLGGEGCGRVKRNKIGVFIADEDHGVLHEGREKDGSGIRTFGMNSGLLSNGNCCYDLLM